MSFVATITGGGAYGTLNLNDHTNYSVTNFTPGVATREKGLLAEGDPYGRVIDRLVIACYGSTKAAASTNLLKLVSKLERAEKWAAGFFLDTYPAVLFNYGPGATTYQAAIFGVPGGAEELLTLQPEYNAELDAFIITGVTVELVRRGAWLGATDTDNVTASPAGDPIDISLSATEDFLSPTKLKILFPHINNGVEEGGGYVIVSDVEAAAVAMDAISPGDNIGSPDANFSTPAVSASSRPYSTTQLLRYTAPDTDTYSQSMAGASPSLSAQANTVALFAVLRNTNATASFSVWFTLGLLHDGYKTDTVYVDKSHTNPRAVCFGLIPTGGRTTLLNDLHVQADAAGGLLDIDYLLLVSLDEGSTIIYLTPDQNTGIGGCTPGGGAANFNYNLTIDPAPLEAPDPLVYVENVCLDGRSYLSWNGNAYIATKNNNLCMVIVMPRSTAWRYTDDSGNLHDFEVEVTRIKAQIAPIAT